MNRSSSWASPSILPPMTLTECLAPASGQTNKLSIYVDEPCTVTGRGTLDPGVLVAPAGGADRCQSQVYITRCDG